MSSSYKELNNLVTQGGKYLNKKNKTLQDLKKLDNINYEAKITREDLLKKAIQKKLAQQKQIQDYENNNLMKKLSRGE